MRTVELDRSATQFLPFDPVHSLAATRPWLTRYRSTVLSSIPVAGISNEVTLYTTLSLAALLSDRELVSRICDTHRDL